MKIAIDLAVRGLRQHLRAPGWVLARAALAVLLLLALLIACGASARLGAPGRSLFIALVWIDFVFLTAIAIGPFASALSEEREGDTLGVLQLAGLRPSAIVFAKAAGLLVSTLLLLLVQVPFATLATTLGGVTMRQVAATFVLLLCYTLGAQGIALACAAAAPDQKRASFRAGEILLVWLLLPSVLSVLLPAVSWAGGTGRGATSSVVSDLVVALGQASPLLAALPAFDRPLPSLLPLAAGLGLAVAPLGFWLAVRALGSAPRHARQDTILRAGRRVGRRPRRARPVGLRTKALIWKEESFLLGGPLAMRRRLVAYTGLWVLLGVLTYDPRGGWLAAWGTFGLWTFLAVGLLEAGVAASHLYRDELRERTLFGLALLPLPPLTWAMAKAYGAMRAVRAPAWLLLASFALLALGRPAAFLVFPVAAVLYVFLGLLIVNLTLYLSLWLPRGAFIVAGGAVLLPTSLLVSTGRFGVACCSFYVIPPFVLWLLLWLQSAIGRRLRVLATKVLTSAARDQQPMTAGAGRVRPAQPVAARSGREVGMSEHQRGVIRAGSVRRIDQPVFVADGAATPGGAMTVVPIVEAGQVQGIEVRCRCGESVLIECLYEENKS